MQTAFPRPDQVLFAAALFTLFVASEGCEVGDASRIGDSSAPAGPRTYPYRIVTTCGMVSDIVSVVASDKAEVTGLMGEGVDPHLYKPARHDVQQLMQADVVFYSGLLLEGRMAETLEQLARRGKPVFAVTDGVDRSYLRSPAGFSGHYDPHVWMDVSAWSTCVAFVAEKLGEFDPENAGVYSRNAETYRLELQGIHEYAQRSIASIPEQQRVLVTAHDAFGYFSRTYSIPVRAAQGMSTESEAGVDDINQLVDFIVDRKISAIFVESSVSPKNVQAILEGAQSKGWKVVIGGQLFSDAMGASGSHEGTYLGMIDHNVTVITRALGGEAPERGLNGKLQP